MRLLLDEMLVRLARLLRSAGHDVALVSAGAPDAAVMAEAVREARLLVTRDRELARLARPQAVLLTADLVDDQALELSKAVEIDWLVAPFTRCAMDNAVLRPMTAQDLERIPKSARDLPGPFNRCPACGRLYWPGSHVKRMLARLTALQAAAHTR
jgi:uncharacterized protein with PIN domain